ncbi:hypothetical protein [Sinomicrobium oceani]|nr:hypothetical protein [Sinomicrobium oceani]
MKNDYSITPYTGVRKEQGHIGMTLLCSMCALLLLCSAGCTREEDNLIITEETWYDTISSVQDNRILEYRIGNVNDDYTIYSAIDDSTGTITVYLPAYYELGVIQAEIKLPEGTTISPDADVPVPVFEEEPFVYEVTSAEGLKATYTVDIVIQQEDFSLNELSRNPDSPVSFSAKESYIRVTGTNILGNYAITRGYLTNEAGERVYTMGEAQTPPTSRQIYLSCIDVEPGLYWIEITSYALTRRMENPINLR